MTSQGTDSLDDQRGSRNLLNLSKLSKAWCLEGCTVVVSQRIEIYEQIPNLLMEIFI